MPKGELATVFLEKMLKANICGGHACSNAPKLVFKLLIKNIEKILLKNKNWI